MAFDAGTIEATLDVRRDPFTEGLKKAQRQARDFEKQRFRATLDLDVDTSRAEAELDREHQRQDGRDVHWDVRVDGDRLHEQLDSLLENTERTAARSGNSIARALLNPMVLQFALLPGIAAGSATASALALAAVPAAFAAIAVLANKDSKKLKDNWLNTWSQIKDETETITAPMVPYLSGIATKTLRAFKNIEPELAGVFKTAGPAVESLADGVLSLATRAMPGLSVATINSGKAIEGVDLLLAHLGDGITDFFTEVSTGSAEAGRGADLLGQILQKALGTLGILVTQFSGAWAQVGPNFVATFNELMDVVTQFTSGGLTGFTSTLRVTLDVLTGVLHVIEPFAGALGAMGGSLLGVIATWKLLTGGVTLAAKAFDLLKPSAVAARLASLTPALNSVGVGLGTVTGKLTGSTAAAEKATSGWARFASGATKAASALPLIGAAIIGLVEANDYFFPSADELATKIMQGGAAATEAKKKIADYADISTLGGFVLSKMGASMSDVNAKINEMRSSMTPLERAQVDATAAQNHLTEVTRKYGEYSPQAKDAQILYANATDRVAQAQKEAADATKTHTDRIVEQTNLMLGEIGARLNYQQSLIQLEQAQKTAADAVKQHGAASVEARDADLQYQQQLLAVVQAVGARAKAEGEAKGVTDSDAYATSAMTQEIVRLAEAAGNNAPPALRQMINGLDNSALAAIGVRREVDNAGNAVYRMPDGKVLTFPNDAGSARLQVQDLHRAIDAVPDAHYTRFYQEVFRTTTVIPPGGGVLPLGDTGQRASGGWIRGPGGPTDDNLLYLLSNGEFVVNAKEAGIFGPWLEWINSGQARKSAGRADGGWSGSGPVISGSVPRETWDKLLAAGWKGDPNDHMEALYPPRPSDGAQMSRGAAVGTQTTSLTRGGNTYIINVTSTRADPVQVASETVAALAWAARGSV